MLLKTLGSVGAFLLVGVNAFPGGAGTCDASDAGISAAQQTMSSRTQGANDNSLITFPSGQAFGASTDSVTFSLPDGTNGFLVYVEDGQGNRVGSWVFDSSWARDMETGNPACGAETLTHINNDAKTGVTFNFMPTVEEDVTVKAIVYTNTNREFVLAEQVISYMAGMTAEPEPTTTEPEGTEPEGSEPEGTEPEGTEPEGTEPEGTEPEGTEPEGTEPEGTEPEGTEPEGTEPEATEPEGTTPAGPVLGDIFMPCKADDSCSATPPGLLCKTRGTSNVCELPGKCTNYPDVTILQDTTFTPIRDACVADRLANSDIGMTGLGACLAERTNVTSECIDCISTAVQCASPLSSPQCSMCLQQPTPDSCLRCAFVACNDAYNTCSGNDLPNPSPGSCSLGSPAGITAQTTSNCANKAQGEVCTVTCLTDFAVAAGATTGIECITDPVTFEAAFDVPAPCVSTIVGGSPASQLSAFFAGVFATAAALVAIQ